MVQSPKAYSSDHGKWDTGTSLHFYRSDSDTALCPAVIQQFFFAPWMMSPALAQSGISQSAITFCLGGTLLFTYSFIWVKRPEHCEWV